MDPGEFDRQVVIERVTSQGNAIGGKGTPTWTPQKTVWAKVVQVGASERFQAEGVLSEKTGTFTMYFDSDVLVTDRLDYAGQKWRITGVKEIGYKEALELTAEAYGSE